MREACVARDNRRSFRYEAVQSAVDLGWWDETGFHVQAATLKNLSRGGALLVSPTLPPEGERIWLCVTGAPCGDWAEVAVVSRSERAEGSRLVRVRFVEACPYEMFSLAVHGISAGV